MNDFPRKAQILDEKGALIAELDLYEDNDADVILSYDPLNFAYGQRAFVLDVMLRARTGRSEYHEATVAWTRHPALLPPPR